MIDISLKTFQVYNEKHYASGTLSMKNKTLKRVRKVSDLSEYNATSPRYITLLHNTIYIQAIRYHSSIYTIKQTSSEVSLTKL